MRCLNAHKTDGEEAYMVAHRISLHANYLNGILADEMVRFLRAAAVPSSD